MTSIRLQREREKQREIRTDFVFAMKNMMKPNRCCTVNIAQIGSMGDVYHTNALNVRIKTMKKGKRRRRNGRINLRL